MCQIYKFMKSFKILLSLALILLAAVCVSGCVSDVPSPADDPVVGTYANQVYVNTTFLKDHADGIMARPTLVFNPDGTGTEYWTDEAGNNLVPLSFTWTNTGNSLYRLNIQNDDGSIFAIEMKLADDNAGLKAVNPERDGTYVKTIHLRDDPVLGTYSYTICIHTDFLKGHEDGIMARPGFIFSADGTGIQTWEDEDGKSLEPQQFIWHNIGNREYHVAMLDGNGAAFTEELTLSEDGRKLQSHYDTWDGVYLRSNIPDDPIAGTFRYSVFIMTDYLEGYEDGIIARPAYIFYPDGTGLETWESTTGKHLPPQSFIWENRGKNLYHVFIWNPDNTVYAEDLRFSADGKELVAVDHTPHGKYTRVVPEMHGDDPVLGSYTYSTYVIENFLKNHAEGINVLLHLFFNADGSGIVVPETENSTLLYAHPFVWAKTGDRMYHLDIRNSNNTAISMEMQLSEDGSELKAVESKVPGSFIRDPETAGADPVLGEFIYSDFFEYNGTTVKSGYIFYAGGRGMETWISKDGETLTPTPLVWEKRGDRTYCVYVLNPDGSLYTETLELSANGNIMTYPDSSDGCYNRVEREMTNDPVAGTYFNSELIDASDLGDFEEGLMVRPILVFSGDNTGIEVANSEEGEYLITLPFVWHNKGDNVYRVDVLNADNTVYSRDMKLSDDGNSLTKLNYTTTNGTYSRYTDNAVVGLFTFSTPVDASYLKDHPEGVIARPSYIFTPLGYGIQTWESESGEKLYPQGFTWEPLGNNTYHVTVLNGNKTLFEEYLKLSADGKELKAVNYEPGGVYIREEINEDDPFIGSYVYSEFTHPTFLSEHSDGIDARPSLCVYPGGAGVQLWVAKDGTLLHPQLFSWEKIGKNVYHIDILNGNDTVFSENLTLSEDGMYLVSDNPETTGVHTKLTQ